VDLIAIDLRLMIAETNLRHYTKLR